MAPKPKKSKADDEAVYNLCLCPTCPSWEECGEKGGFCLESTGKSNCIMEERGCICSSCTVTKLKKWTHNYYCLRGSEKEQNKKK